MASSVPVSKSSVEKNATSSITLDPSCVVSEKATLIGKPPITIAPDAIVHPHARIDSTAGAVHIGHGVIIWERVVIGASEAATSSKPIHIGDLTVIEAFANISPGTNVGHHCEIGVRADIQTDCVIGDYVKVTAGSLIEQDPAIPDYMVVFGDPQQSRIDVTAKENELVRTLKEKNHMQHLELLKKLVKSGNFKWT